MRREFLIPAVPTAPAKSREALSAVIPPPELADRFHDAQLAITEVVTNAVRHAGLQEEAVRLIIDADEFQLRVAAEQATDASAAHPVEPIIDGENTGGFGLVLVEKLADDWGVEPGPPGVVWFQFRRHSVPTS
jgi:anti-sigma regulatory factor (Ser/Thr protein kinase)